MSNHENETIKENIYEELLDCGYTDEQIERYDMVDLLFYRDKELVDILKSVLPENPAYTLQKQRV
tara:strand:+ start:547 stop:741 length:195 start_codon:yes stop_codon:yes gene_type:complete